MTYGDKLALFLGLEPSVNLDTTRYEYSEFWVMRDELTERLNEYGQMGWKAVHIVEEDHKIRRMCVLMERPINEVANIRR